MAFWKVWSLWWRWRKQKDMPDMIYLYRKQRYEEWLASLTDEEREQHFEYLRKQEEEKKKKSEESRKQFFSTLAMMEAIIDRGPYRDFYRKIFK